jgi:hypothetical protein
MKVRVRSQYQDNSAFAGRQIYNINGTGILYDQLAPSILQHEDVEINSTWGSVRLFTRDEADIYYVLRERGE